MKLALRCQPPPYAPWTLILLLGNPSSSRPQSHAENPCSQATSHAEHPTSPLSPNRVTPMVDLIIMYIYMVISSVRILFTQKVVSMSMPDFAKVIIMPSHICWRSMEICWKKQAQSMYLQLFVLSMFNLRVYCHIHEMCPRCHFQQVMSPDLWKCWCIK